jgi:hypothetical protein
MKGTSRDEDDSSSSSEPTVIQKIAKQLATQFSEELTMAVDGSDLKLSLEELRLQNAMSRPIPDVVVVTDLPH